MNAKIQSINVTIIGSGNTGHLYAGLLSSYAHVKATLFTRKADAVKAGLTEKGIRVDLPNGEGIHGVPHLVTNDAREAVADADIVILTVPVHVRGKALADIAPNLPRDKPVYVGAIPGFSGFDLMADDIVGHLPNVVIWGLKDVPYMAYAPVPGVSSVMGGPKETLFLATHDKHDAQQQEGAHAALEKLFPAPIEMMSSYLSITLTPGNPIMHPTILYALIGPWSQWDGKPFKNRIQWWTEASELGSYFLSVCDAEMTMLRNEFTRRGKNLSGVYDIHKEIVDAYGDQIADPRTLMSTLKTNKAYDGAYIPMVRAKDDSGWLVDVTSRAFCEDVPFGLSLLVGLGVSLGVKTPMMAEIEAWALSVMQPEHRAVTPVLAKMA